jgi:hypothetical protein
MLNKVIASIKGALLFGLVATLLVFMTGHMVLVRIQFSTEWAASERTGLRVAADPGCT